MDRDCIAWYFVSLTLETVSSWSPRNGLVTMLNLEVGRMESGTVEMYLV